MEEFRSYRGGFLSSITQYPAVGAFVTCLLLLALVSTFTATASDAQIDRLRKFKKDRESAQADDAPMALVPAGEFWMGVDGMIGLDDERPRHRVWLDAFSMDLYEVTVSRYARFLGATDRPVPWMWETANMVLHGDRPVIGVDWADAEAFCQWAGKRLPTEAEWEKAARGTDERHYPWGNATPTSNLANFAVGARFSYSQALMPVGSYEKGKSPYEIYDLAGNVWEWVQDWYSGSYYEHSPERNPMGPEEGQFKVLRGGSWSDLPKYLLSYGRFKLLPTTRNSYIGFRCAKSVTS
jgi:formylglycine-generating enzyme required for sulfatase activity